MVKIVTDSASDIPSKVVEELGITIVPLYLHFGTEVYRDRIDLSTEEFYRKLARSRVFPATSAPPPAEFAKAFNKLAEETDEILMITVGAKLSATYEGALRGRELVSKKCRIEVIDSLSGIMGLGLIVIAAAREAEAGVDLERVVEVTRQAITKSHVRVCFDTLEYLRRGGRIGRAQALLGAMLKVNPIIGLEDGEVVPIGRERSRARAIESLYHFATSFTRVNSLAVEYATTPEEALALAQRLSGIAPPESTYVSSISPVVGAHTGPGVLGGSILEG